VGCQGTCTGGRAAHENAQAHGDAWPGAAARPAAPGAAQTARQRATFVAAKAARNGSVEPNSQPAERGARTFGRSRPARGVGYEHVFCLTRTSTLRQRARDALALARAFVLLEDDESCDWEVSREERTPASNEPRWAPAHRAQLYTRRKPRRGGQPAPSPQPCLSPVQPSGPGARPTAGHRWGGPVGNTVWPIGALGTRS
jgi:hypothetical protein